MSTWLISPLLAQYACGSLTPSQMVVGCIERLRSFDLMRNPIWIHSVNESDLMVAAKEIEGRRRNEEVMPLYGVPFAVKDTSQWDEYP